MKNKCHNRSQIKLSEWTIAFIACSTILCVTPAAAQVVNMESRRLHTDSLRKAGDINFAFLYNSTNGKSITTFRGNLAVQLKSKNYKHLWLLVSNYDLAKAEGDNFINSFFVHLRYNYTIRPWLKWELFTQSQVNEPLGIALRQLTGSGPRFKVTAGEKSNFYFGIAYMYEYEKEYTDPPIYHNDSRLSSYASFSINIPVVNGDLVSTLYFQPLFNDFSNYRFTNETKIDFHITKKFRIYTRFSYYYDTRPTKGIRKNVLGLEQGFGLSL